jgi:hypothetical protein
MSKQRALMVAVSFLFGLFIFTGTTTRADVKKKEEKDKPKASKVLLNKADELTDNDEKDTHKSLQNSPRKVYKLKLTEGKIYQIDLKSADFDAVLRLEDAGGKELALNDDFMVGSLNSRILYAVSKSAEYRIIATCLNAKPGKFQLTVAEAPPGTTVSMFKGPATELTLKAGKASAAGLLDEKAPIVRNHYFRVFTLKMEEGKTYRIDHRSGDFDAFLFLEDPLGNILAQDDDSGGGLDSRIVFKAPRSGTFRIITTSLAEKEKGKFTLDVAETGPKGNLDARAPRLERLDTPVLTAR